MHIGDDLFVLRPSLYAMSQIGQPAEIVDVFVRVMADAGGEKGIADQFGDALAVLHACADRDMSAVFGYFDETLKYVPGAADVAHIIPLARCLLRHGVTGAIPPLPRRADEEPEYLREFVARDHVALAIAHLGLSEREAWAMTMTGLVSSMRAKFPQIESNAPGARAPTKEEHEATMDWFDKIEAKRKARVAKGAN
ncbi:DUF6246 family protein [Pseudomonas denitrificans (nom. rej.)]|nr:DUF6246 family protein [Pseudomonas denitrificans (nom. rej.)]